VSREALALDISRVVSRVVSGEAVDTAERGAALAAKYPDVGMSGESISEAIARAAGMVGMIKSAPPPPKPPPGSRPIPVVASNVVAAAPAPVLAAPLAEFAPRQTEQRPQSPPVAVPAASQAIDDLLAAAIDAEIGDLVSGRRPAPAAVISTNGAEQLSSASPPGATLSTETDAAPPPQTGPLSALRRALFRR
jgi:hypothetical protein